MIPLRDQDHIRDRFARELEGRVKLDYFTQKQSLIYLPGREECATCEDGQQLVEEIAALSEKITLTVRELAEEREEAAKLRVDKVPAIVLRGPANRALRFFGIPGGNEFPNFIETIIEMSKAKVEVGPETARHLKKLKDSVSIEVYVTPTCPHCPGVVRAAYRLALANAHIKTSAIEISEFPRIGQRLGVQAVPLTIINGQSSVLGAVDETALAEHALKAASGVAGSTAGGESSSAVAPAAGGQPGGGLILPR